MAEPAVRELVNTDQDIEIIWRAFELRPEPVPMLDPGGDYLQRVWQSSVYPMAAQLGINMVLPPIQPRSRLAHEAAYWARSQGRFDDYHGEVFGAFFERGEDIGDIDLLIALAVELELEGGSLRRALETHEFEADVLADEQRAAALGVRAVPAFIANGQAALSGVQPFENLRKLLDSTTGVH